MAVTEAAAETDDFILTLSNPAGDSVEVAVTFPKNKALLGIRALMAVGEPEYITTLLSEFRDDPTVAASLKEAGLGFADDDDEDDFYYEDYNDNYDDEEDS